MKNLVLFGMQGAGKGTQAKILAEKFGYRIFETGAELRALMKESSDLAKKVKEIVERGDLVPNEIVMEIISQFVEATPSETPILFDGIPRSLPQKETFDALIAKHYRPIQGIFIDINRSEALERLLMRGRSDDNEEAIERRLSNYETETLPVIETYEKEGILKRVPGMQSIEAVAEDIEAAVKQGNSQ